MNGGLFLRRSLLLSLFSRCFAQASSSRYFSLLFWTMFLFMCAAVRLFPHRFSLDPFLTSTTALLFPARRRRRTLLLYIHTPTHTLNSHTYISDSCSPSRQKPREPGEFSSSSSSDYVTNDCVLYWNNMETRKDLIIFSLKGRRRWSDESGSIGTACPALINCPNSISFAFNIQWRAFHCWASRDKR